MGDGAVISIDFAVDLIARDMNQVHPAMTITRMDAGVEPPWMVSRRVIGGCVRFMSLANSTR